MNERENLYSLLALLVVIVLTVIQVNLQYEKLVESVEFSESLWADMDEEWGEVFDYVQNLRDRNSTAANQLLFEETRAVSRKYATSFAVVRDAIERISLLPWNQSHRNVKTEYLRHLDVRVGNLKNVGEKLRTPELETTWDQFCSQATKSSPLLAFGRFDTRLAQICARGIE